VTVELPGPSEESDERVAFGREALARLVLSDEAARVADYATGLVSTRNDMDTGKGGRASQAAQLVAMAEAALDAAVIYERERGATWAEIASYLGMSSADVEERFSDHLATWHRALAAATRAPATPGLPWVLKDPAHAGDYLDSWARRRVVLTKDRHEVTGSMLGLPLPGEPGWSP
jgi:hypothetical protein